MPHVEILKDLYFVERGYLNGNHFVYRSNAPILIDTGYKAHFAETERAIAALGVNLSRTRLIVNTHTHSDHIGGNKIIQDKSGCDIALHQVGKHFIDTRDDWSTWWRYKRQEADFFECTLGLEDGDTVDIGPHEFRVIYTPGHASDGIVLYNEKGKVLISSDTLWENDVATVTVRIEGSTAPFRCLESLETIESLDVKVVYPGHGAPFSDFKGAVSRAEKKIRGYLAQPEKTGQDLLKRITVYTLLMHGEIPEDRLFDLFMEAHWFRETVDLYFSGDYRGKFDEVLGSFLRRGIVKQRNGCFYTMVKP
ncbi:MAG: MBL fold metallo-hydrolase [Deltaproteobacteria bacterium]|nr:MBL fold metallo-hydrolase [Deltaproteobacteria bacterium]